jgi:hypothetical protein
MERRFFVSCCGLLTTKNGIRALFNIIAECFCHLRLNPMLMWRRATTRERIPVVLGFSADRQGFHCGLLQSSLCRFCYRAPQKPTWVYSKTRYNLISHFSNLIQSFLDAAREHENPDLLHDAWPTRA